MNTTQCPECLSTNLQLPAPNDPDTAIDCLDCGIWFDPGHPNSQPDHPLFGMPLLDGPPELLYCAICDENLRDSTPDTLPVIIARWQDQWICTDCLDNRPGKAEAEAEARGKRQPMTQQEYRDEGGFVCPTCRKGYIVIRTYGENSSLYQQCRCAAGHDFDMVFRLGGYIRNDDEHEDEDLNAIQDVLAVDMAEEEV